MCVNAGTICLCICRDLQSDMNWKTELNSTNQLATDGLALMTEHILTLSGTGEGVCYRSHVTLQHD